MKKAENSFSLALYIARLLTQLCLLLLVSVLPLIMRDGYFDLGDTKWRFFTGLLWGFRNRGLYVPGLFPLIALAACFALPRRTNIRKGNGRSPFRISSIPLYDRFAILYILAVLVSTLFSGFRGEAWIGSSGFYMGTLAQLSFAVLYFTVSRLGQYRRAVTAAALGASFITFVIGLLQRFSFDPFHLYAGVSPADRISFLSTIGQSSWFSCYIGTMLPLSLFLFWYSKKKPIRILSLLHLSSGSMMLATVNADGALFSAAAFLFILFWFSCRGVPAFLRFLESCLAVMFSIILTGILDRIFPGRLLVQTGIMRFLSGSPLLYLLSVLLVCVRFIMPHLSKKNGAAVTESFLGKLRRSVGMALAGAMLLIIIYIVANSCGFLPAGLSANNNYLMFGPDWGNSRGIIWSSALRIWHTMLLKDPLHALFGAGPDCFYQAAMVYCRDFLDSYWGVAGFGVNNAHCEYLHLLVTIGITGLLCYLGWIISALASFFAKAKEQPVLIAIIMIILSYAAQNIFCYQTVTSTPFMILALGTGANILKEEPLKR